MAVAVPRERRARRAAELCEQRSQEEAAKILGVSEVTVSRDLAWLGVKARPRGGQPAEFRRRRRSRGSGGEGAFKCRVCGKRRGVAGVCDGCAHPLRDARLAAGFTQAELGLMAGVTQVSVQRIETRRLTPSIELAQQLADAVDRSMRDLFGEPSPCRCGCGRLCFAGLVEGHAARVRGEAAAGFLSEREQLRAHAAERGYVIVPQAAHAEICDSTTVLELIHAGRLRARRYRGRWTPAGRPWLIRRADAATIRELLEQRHRERSEALARRNTVRYLNGEYEPLREKIGAKTRARMADVLWRYRLAVAAMKGRERAGWRPYGPDARSAVQGRLAGTIAAQAAGRVRGRRPVWERKPENVALLRELRREHPTWGRPRLAKAAGLTEDEVRSALSHLVEAGG